ncbi:MAG: dipicolinate synthase subunit DpsA, partial [Clostridiales bacterium]|nr:dipicolinate synthase subunit DpsA [Clostridiales bacterium]
LGGDYRYKLLCDELISDGYNVKAFGNGFIKPQTESFSELLEDIDVLIGPIPTTKDSETVCLADCPSVKLSNLFEEMYRKNISVYIGGVINSEIKAMSLKYNIKTYDFFACEEVAIYNAVPTAEGAIATAIQESDITLFDSRCLVLGYGRCGKVLANMLKGMGARVYSTYRNEPTAAYIKAFGIKGFNLYELKSRVGSFDFIFNTIPCEILNREILKKTNKKCLIIDLAQAPGGTDFNFARDLNIRALYCPGLPGRVAPLTAAEILKSAVLNIALNQSFGE